MDGIPVVVGYGFVGDVVMAIQIVEILRRSIQGVTHTVIQLHSNISLPHATPGIASATTVPEPDARSHPR